MCCFLNFVVFYRRKGDFQLLIAPHLLDGSYAANGNLFWDDGESTGNGVHSTTKKSHNHHSNGIMLNWTWMNMNPFTWQKSDFLEMFWLVVADTVEKKDYMAWFIYNRWQEGNASPKRCTWPCALTWNLFFVSIYTVCILAFSLPVLYWITTWNATWSSPWRPASNSPPSSYTASLVALIPLRCNCVWTDEPWPSPAIITPSHSIQYMRYVEYFPLSNITILLVIMNHQLFIIHVTILTTIFFHRLIFFNLVLFTIRCAITVYHESLFFVDFIIHLVVIYV